ncbi:response regulator [Hufsiella ginkgonis]|uniref:Response regulator n=1 Tax=Hufsiella ginkgonis TaxID=2695274 RepID=A0A7K1XVX0_9SPHI|nr:response regulator [Hufsiella ginkgonis]MXV15121.1 response regulator [Hufsiella ginkgonis]
MEDKSKTILAVDDNLMILEVLNEILALEGYHVVTLSDGGDIFQIIEDIHPDLILLDVMLADLDGRVICKSIKEYWKTRNIPVILISASHNLEESLNKPGAPDDFIAKPFDIYYLLEKIDKQLAA